MPDIIAFTAEPTNTTPASGPAESGPTSSPEPPAKTRKNGWRKGKGTTRKGIHFTRITPKLEASIVAMSAGGVTNRKTAKVHGVSPETVGKIIRKPENQEFIAGSREYMRAHALANLLDTQKGAWLLLKEAVDRHDYKAFDAIARGLTNLERIGSSAGGDSQKIDTTHIVKSDLALEEAKELLKRLALTG